jgi:hypothetical protein
MSKTNTPQATDNKKQETKLKRRNKPSHTVKTHSDH